LGTSFRWLVASSWTTNIGDGLMMAAGPLLVASQTHNPTLVAAATMARLLPWLLFGLVAGALADRLDRRLVVTVMNGARAIVLAGLCAVIYTGHVNIGLVLVAMFLVGVAEVFADTTTGTLTPMLVDKADLGIANARIMAGFLTANQLIGPAVGAVLFTAGMVWPFLVQTICVAVGSSSSRGSLHPGAPCVSTSTPTCGRTSSRGCAGWPATDPSGLSRWSSSPSTAFSA
jgi:hypothetical protein